MQAKKIIVGGKAFLLPDSHWSRYNLDDEYAGKLKSIIEYVLNEIKTEDNPLLRHIPNPDFNEIKQTTSIIGYPFTGVEGLNVDIFAKNQGIEIVDTIYL